MCLHTIWCVCVCVRLRFGCSLCDDTHTAAFDTAGGSEELERERKEETQGEERRQKLEKKTGGEGTILCLFVANYACLMCICVCVPCVSSFPCENVLLQSHVSVMHM